MNILVVGGAGYIGSHTLRALLRAGHDPVVFDNLGRGHRAALEALEAAGGRAIPLMEADLGDAERLREVFAARRFDAVMHFAAFIAVGESVLEPALYYRNNVAATAILLDEMTRAGVRRLVFSSTAAVYGTPLRVPIDEDHPLDPINPYGRGKLMIEQMLVDLAAANQIDAVALRYFNACGATPDAAIGELHVPETHLIPLALAATEAKPLSVFGQDYPTPDGTAIRDYIHVDDLAAAHLQALYWMEQNRGLLRCNVGLGRGYSVKEVIAAIERVTGRKVPCRFTARREGDPPELVAAASRIRRELRWEPRYTQLEAIIETAEKWHRKSLGAK